MTAELSKDPTPVEAIAGGSPPLPLLLVELAPTLVRRLFARSG